MRYSFTKTAPVIHPLPRKPLLHSIRSTRAAKAFDLIYFEQRRVGIVPNPPLRPGRPYIHSVVLQLIRFLFAYTMFDLVSYPITYFAPNTYGSVYMRDYPSFVEWVKLLAGQYGIDWRVMWTFFAWSFSLGMVFGFETGAHVVALVTVGIGYNLDEEWPKVSDWWIFKPSSVNEFWGKRYHQVSLTSICTHELIIGHEGMYHPRLWGLTQGTISILVQPFRKIRSTNPYSLHVLHVDSVPHCHHVRTQSPSVSSCNNDILHGSGSRLCIRTIPPEIPWYTSKRTSWEILDDGGVDDYCYTDC